MSNRPRDVSRRRISLLEFPPSRYDLESRTRIPDLTLLSLLSGDSVWYNCGNVASLVTGDSTKNIEVDLSGYKYLRRCIRDLFHFFPDSHKMSSL